MTTWELIKSKREEANVIASQMSQMLTEKRGALDTEHQAKFDEMSIKINSYKKEIANLESAYDASKINEKETRSLVGRDTETATVTESDTEVSEKRSKAFSQYLRCGLSKMQPEYRDMVLQGMTPEMRSLTAGGIGIVGDRQFYNGLFESLKNYAGAIEAGATVFSRSDGNPFSIATVDDTSNAAAQVAEAGDTFAVAVSGADGADPSFSVKTLTPKKYSSKWILLSLELLQDNAFNAEQYIYNAASKRIGRQLNTDITTTLKTATTGATTASGSAITYADWMGFTTSLNYAYRKNKNKVKIELSDAVLTKVRSIVDDSHRPIFLNMANPQEGVTEYLDGFQYVVNDSFDTLTASGDLGVIADHEQAVGIASVVNPVVVRADQLFMEYGMVGFIVFSRHDYTLLDSAAIRLWKAHS